MLHITPPASHRTLLLQIFDPQDTPGGSEEGEEKRETKHAPDLLEGPDIDDEGRKQIPNL